MRDNECVYRVIPVFLFFSEALEGIGPDPVKPYRIDDKSINQLIELKHGKSARLFTMDKVSNSAFLPVGAQSSSFGCHISEYSAERVRTSAESIPD
jgi:hypothetical protein